MAMKMEMEMEMDHPFKTPSRLALTRTPSPLGMHYELDAYEEEQQTTTQQYVAANRRYLTAVGHSWSQQRAQHDWLYTMLFHYQDYTMDVELDAIIAFVLNKYSMGHWDAEERRMRAPMALHPNPSLSAPALDQSDDTLPINGHGWPEATSLARSLPESVRRQREGLFLYSDQRNLWFIRDTLRQLRQLPPEQHLLKRFFILVALGMEPELFDVILQKCPPELIKDARTDANFASFQDTLHHLATELVAQFNYDTAADIIRGFMLRVTCTYDMGGVIR